MINGHGDDTHQYSKITANFSSNVYQQLDLSGLKQHLAQHMAAIHGYPEPDAHSVAELIAKKEDILISNVAVTNGATEAIYLIAQAFQGSKTTILAPVFSEYADASAIHGHQIAHIFSLDELPEETDLFWLCNPNNPTGEVYPQDKLLELIQRYPKTCFVIDHSYAAFTTQQLLEVAKAIQYPNVILLHSLTKHFAIAGLRLGYITAHANLIKKVNYFRMPWSVNGLAIVAARYLLLNEQHLQIDLQTLLMHTNLLQQNLSHIEHLKVLPSQTHYFLVRLYNERTAAELKNYLANEHHMLIRDAANFVGLDKTYFRVCCQNQEQNSALVAAIGQWCNGAIHNKSWSKR